MKRYLRYIISFIVLSIFFITNVYAGGVISDVPSDNSSSTAGGPPTPDNPDVTPAPIDGGITLLLAAGIGYGVKKHRENKKKKTVDLE